MISKTDSQSQTQPHRRARVSIVLGRFPHLKADRAPTPMRYPVRWSQNNPLGYALSSWLVRSLTTQRQINDISGSRRETWLSSLHAFWQSIYNHCPLFCAANPLTRWPPDVTSGSTITWSVGWGENAGAPSQCFIFAPVFCACYNQTYTGSSQIGRKDKSCKILRFEMSPLSLAINLKGLIKS